MPIVHHRQIVPQFLDQMNQLAGFLLGQKIELEVKIEPLRLETRLAVLRDQDHGGREEGPKAEEALQPVEGWWVESRQVQARSERVVYLDVREPNEWNLGRLPHAIHLPRGNLETKVEAVIDRNQKVVIYCARGNRSALAALTMKQMGYENVASMARGFQGWADINGEVEE